jgi:hypothetical protein
LIGCSKNQSLVWDSDSKQSFGLAEPPQESCP